MVTRIARQSLQATQEAAQRATRKVVKNASRIAGGVLGLAGERMTKVDTAWLRMDSHHNLMMIVGVWVLRPGIGYDALCERVTGTLLKYPRFRQRVVEDGGGATWVEDRKLDVHDHIVREKLPRGRKA